VAEPAIFDDDDEGRGGCARAQLGATATALDRTGWDSAGLEGGDAPGPELTPKVVTQAMRAGSQSPLSKGVRAGIEILLAADRRIPSWVVDHHTWHTWHAGKPAKYAKYVRRMPLDHGITRSGGTTVKSRNSGASVDGRLVMSHADRDGVLELASEE
jgi:hypothetical protein